MDKIGEFLSKDQCNCSKSYVSSTSSHTKTILPVIQKQFCCAKTTGLDTWWCPKKEPWLSRTRFVKPKPHTMMVALIFEKFYHLCTACFTGSDWWWNPGCRGHTEFRTCWGSCAWEMGAPAFPVLPQIPMAHWWVWKNSLHKHTRAINLSLFTEPQENKPKESNSICAFTRSG